MKFLFDWNGTIADDAGRACLATNAALISVGAGTIRPSEFDRNFLLPLDAMFLRLGVQPDRLQAAAAEWNSAMAGQPAPIRAGAADFLARLHGDGEFCAVISAAGADYLLAELRAFEVDDCIDVVLSGAADKVKALRELRRGEEAVYFGDTEYDMASAVAAGCFPVGVLTGYCPEEKLRAAGAQVIITDYTQLSGEDVRSMALARAN
ncbi:MAG TPA: hypothetical protein DIT15_07030 [Arthrobacter bacterium]|jgi:phosphoglycolate phosphatase|nr:hypothetical protein [Arthrobacter sp.]HAP91064.1 hypothetical protein [Arthrobacter sp.]HBH58630.1 hypothetical protein [Arthrobacter sp.]HCB57099.1 hypothetical protein [Arthrobacter sp.]HCC40862.1 hypothetical protein [Arthrobacter sp.]